MPQPFQIAIDGPVAAGKSTVARQVAERLGFLYIDTGATYRVVTLMALRQHLDLSDENQLIKLIDNLDIEVRLPDKTEQDGRQSTVLVNGEDVSWEIRKGSVSRDVAKVAALPQVRAALVPLQQRLAQDQNVVMEGRDITYAVLPQADLKIFLTASEDSRIDRYFHSRTVQKKHLTRHQVAAWLKERDDMDWNRAVNPLQITPGVWQFDTSNLSLNKVVDQIVKKAQELLNQTV
ncbi:cytidylate kinase [Microgenomates group bacterium RIFCSPLOWO2_01_FULL_46_13]|nr:MAG: cytidylate kinase [Microgenomates group bacterium RIFCSPHIGHO2_01_FULL_45_11]OGV95066.1 MAG: cytidylate kinase [Microgenomates group bacterium RIFCSPLOWO2_01_FULL_46_13]